MRPFFLFLGRPVLCPAFADKPYFENHRIMDTDYESYSITYLCLSAGSEYITGNSIILTWYVMERQLFSLSPVL